MAEPKNVGDGPWTKRFVLTLHPHTPSWDNMTNRQAVLKWLSDGVFNMFQDPNDYLVRGTRWVVDPASGKRVAAGRAPVRLDGPVKVEYQFEVGPIKRQIHAHIIVTVELADAESNVDIRLFHKRNRRDQRTVSYGVGVNARHAWWRQFWDPPTFRARGADTIINTDTFAWNVRTIWGKDPAKATFEYITKMITKMPTQPPGGPTRDRAVQRYERRGVAYGGYVEHTEAEARAIRAATLQVGERRVVD